MPEKLINLRMDEEDQELLEACARHEKLTKSEILRRALREYARKLEMKVGTSRPARSIAHRLRSGR
jgi:hypothetical protein